MYNIMIINNLHIRRPSVCRYLAFFLALPVMVNAQVEYLNYSTNSDNTITITGYTGPSGVGVVIPDTINGLTVTVIGDSAFFSANITGVTFPSSLASIGSSVFANNFNWTSPLVIPAGVTNVGGGAFGATEVSSVFIPASLTTIGDGAFSAAYGVQAYTVDPANPVYTNSPEGVLYTRDMTDLVQYPAGRSGTYLIPNTVLNIGANAFDGCENLPAITIPDSVTNMGNYALSNTQRLYNITIGAHVATIGYGVFQTAYNLKGLYFRGNAPVAAGGEVGNYTPAIVYYLPGTTGWGTKFDTIPAELWNPQMVNAGIQTNTYSFSLTGSTNLIVGVDVSTNLASPTNWVRVSTFQLTTSGTGSFSDASWAGSPARFYRLSAP